MLRHAPVTIKSVDPKEGYEGTIVTLKGSGFAEHVRNNCIVVGGMGACARAEPGGSDRELKVKIGPVAKRTHGEILMWPGIGLDLHTEVARLNSTELSFSEVAVFRNGAPQAAARVDFELTKASANTFAGSYEASGAKRGVELGGFEGGAMRVSIPRKSKLSSFAAVDVCIVLKEPTLAVDFSAAIKAASDEECLRAVAKAITVNAALVGERVFADVTADAKSGALTLFVSKPYLERGMVTLRFS